MSSLTAANKIIDNIVDTADSMGINKSSIKTYAIESFMSSPITFMQAALSVTFYSLTTMQLIPGHINLFHTALVSRNISQVYRIVTSTYLFDGNLFSIVGQIVQGYAWKSRLEDSLATQSRISMAESRIKYEKYNNNKQERDFNIQREIVSFISSIGNDRYFQIQLLTMSVVVVQEIILHYLLFNNNIISSILYLPLLPFSSNRSISIVNPLSSSINSIISSPNNVLYSLNPNFEYTLFFLWAMRFKNSSTRILNIIPVPTILFPLGLVVFSRFRNLNTFAKSLTAAIIVAKLMNLKCHMSDESMVHGFLSSSKKISSLVYSFIKERLK